MPLRTFLLVSLIATISWIAAPDRLMAQEASATASTPTNNNTSEYIIQAKQAVGRKDFDAAVSWYKKAAELGDVSSMYEIGQIYWGEHGINDFVKEHHSEAEHWYRQAADHGNAPAMNWLGWLYYNTHSTTMKSEDWAASLPWFQKAADLGYAPAMTQLGVMYNSDGSMGVPEDHVKAAQFFLKAAQIGDAQAMDNLGVMYGQGKGVPKDIDKAVYWWKKAVETDPNGPIGKAAQSWLDLHNGKPLCIFCASSTK